MFIFNKHFGINISWYIRGRFTTNGLELKHRLHKKTTDKDGMAKEILETWITLKTWRHSYYSEVRRAIPGLGNYRPASEFLNLYIAPTLWVQWFEEEKSQLYEALLCSIIQVLEYSKPKCASLRSNNSGKNKRRARLPEPEWFMEGGQYGRCPWEQFNIISGKEEDKWKLKISWAGMHTNKRVD